MSAKSQELTFSKLFFKTSFDMSTIPFCTASMVKINVGCPAYDVPVWYSK